MNEGIEWILWNLWEACEFGYSLAMDILKLVLLVYLICLARRAARLLKQREQPKSCDGKRIDPHE